MNATFTVDAFQGEVFQAKISQIRLAATTVQNVVAYYAMLEVSNPLRKLKPGMTANVKIVVEQADNALRLPNAALRFRPTMPCIMNSLGWPNVRLLSPSPGTFDTLPQDIL